MFDVSWTDPTRETVGQRKARKEQQSTDRLSRKSSTVSKKSSLRSSNSSGPVFVQHKPSFLGVFGSGRKESASRTGYYAKDSIQTPPAKAPRFRRLSSFTAISDSSGQELPGIITQNPSAGFFAGTQLCCSEGEISSRSDGSFIDDL